MLRDIETHPGVRRDLPVNRVDKLFRKKRKRMESENEGNRGGGEGGC